MLDDEPPDAPSRSATLHTTRPVIVHAGPGPARDPPASVDANGPFDPRGGGWRAIWYPLDDARTHRGPGPCGGHRAPGISRPRDTAAHAEHAAAGAQPPSGDVLW